MREEKKYSLLKRVEPREDTYVSVTIRREHARRRGKTGQLTDQHCRSQKTQGRLWEPGMRGWSHIGQYTDEKENGIDNKCSGRLYFLEVTAVNSNVWHDEFNPHRFWGERIIKSSAVDRNAPRKQVKPHSSLEQHLDVWLE